MTITSRVLVAFRVVRVAALAFAASLLVGFLAVATFAAHYGSLDSAVVMDISSSADRVLVAAIAEQEDAGLRCSERPALTDVVLFQRGHGMPVDVLTFDQAIEASAAQQGWVRRYCV